MVPRASPAFLLELDSPDQAKFPPRRSTRARRRHDPSFSRWVEHKSVALTGGLSCPRPERAAGPYCRNGASARDGAHATWSGALNCKLREGGVYQIIEFSCAVLDRNRSHLSQIPPKIPHKRDVYRVRIKSGSASCVSKLGQRRLEEWPARWRLASFPRDAPKGPEEALSHMLLDVAAIEYDTHDAALSAPKEPHRTIPGARE
jgi:hypothetical protein